MKKILLAALTLLSLQTIANDKGEKHKEETKKFSITINNKAGTELQVKINNKSWMKALAPWTSKTYTREKFNALALRRVIKVAKDGQKAEKQYIKIDHNLSLSKNKNQQFWVKSKSVSSQAPEENEVSALRMGL